MMEFTKNSFGTLRADIEAALSAVGQKHGISLKTGAIRFTPSSATIKLEAVVLTAGGASADRREADWDFYCRNFGLRPEDKGKTFTYQGRTFTLKGIDVKRKKYPILVDMVGRGLILLPLASVRQAMSTPISAAALSSLAPERKKQKILSEIESGAIMRKIVDCYGRLSPENLTCDGELSARQTRHRRRDINKELEGLFAQLGRKVSETEAWDWYEKNR